MDVKVFNQMMFENQSGNAKKEQLTVLTGSLVAFVICHWSHSGTISTQYNDLSFSIVAIMGCNSAGIKGVGLTWQWNVTY